VVIFASEDEDLVNKWVCSNCKKTNERFETECEYCYTRNVLVNRSSFIAPVKNDEILHKKGDDSFNINNSINSSQNSFRKESYTYNASINSNKMSNSNVNTTIAKKNSNSLLNVKTQEKKIAVNTNSNTSHKNQPNLIKRSDNKVNSIGSSNNNNSSKFKTSSTTENTNYLRNSSIRTIPKK